MFESLRNIRIPSAPRVWLPGRSTPFKRNIHILHGHAVQRHGKDILWVQPGWASNILHDEGEQAILSAYFDTDLATYGAPPAALFFGLDNRAALAETDTLAMAGFNEPTSAGGYARETISTSTGFTLAQATTFYAATSAVVTFEAIGAAYSTAVKHGFLCTVASGTAGKLLASLALSTPRTLGDGDSLTYSLSVGLSE